MVFTSKTSSRSGGLGLLQLIAIRSRGAPKAGSWGLYHNIIIISRQWRGVYICIISIDLSSQRFQKVSTLQSASFARRRRRRRRCKPYIVREEFPKKKWVKRFGFSKTRVGSKKGLLPLDGKVAHQHSHPLNVSFPFFFNFTTQQIDISFFSEQEFSELFGLVPHSAHEESYSNHHTDVDNDKVI